MIDLPDPPRIEEAIDRHAGTLRGYQRDAVLHALTRRRSVLRFSTGMGETAVATAIGEIWRDVAYGAPARDRAVLRVCGDPRGVLQHRTNGLSGWRRVDDVLRRTPDAITAGLVIATHFDAAHKERLLELHRKVEGVLVVFSSEAALPLCAGWTTFLDKAASDPVGRRSAPDAIDFEPHVTAYEGVGRLHVRIGGGAIYERFGTRRVIRLPLEALPQTVWAAIVPGTPASRLHSHPGLSDAVVRAVVPAADGFVEVQLI